VKRSTNIIYGLFMIKLLRFVVLELCALLISLVLVGVVGMGAAIATGYIYDISHDIPDPVARGDDLGAGLIMIAALILSLLISIPACVVIHVVIYKKFWEWLK
jgi:hypothetical protein